MVTLSSRFLKHVVMQANQKMHRVEREFVHLTLFNSCFTTRANLHCDESSTKNNVECRTTLCENGSCGRGDGNSAQLHALQRRPKTNSDGSSGGDTTVRTMKMPPESDSCVSCPSWGCCCFCPVDDRKLVSHKEHRQAHRCCFLAMARIVGPPSLFSQHHTTHRTNPQFNEFKLFVVRHEHDMKR